MPLKYGYIIVLVTLVKHQMIKANETTINVSDLASGIYYANISQKNNKQIPIKILKE